MQNKMVKSSEMLIVSVRCVAFDLNINTKFISVYPIIREYDKPVLFNKAGAVSHSEALSLAVYADQPGKIQRHPSQPPVAAPSHVPKVRKDFPETWLWQMVNVNE